MSKDTSLWNKIMKAALAIPGVSVDRTAFLRNELKEEITEEDLQQAIKLRPAMVVSEDIIAKKANGVINYHTATVTSLSTITGLPGGPVIMASIPADLAQYYFHVFVLAQKLAYLYGFPDLRDDDKKLNNDATDLLTLFVGIMMGAQMANDVVRDIARDLALQLSKKMPQKVMAKAVYYPIVKQVAKAIGLNLSKSSFSKTFGKFIPLLGGIISGGITYATFYPGSKKLQKALQKQMDLLGNDINVAPEEESNADMTDFLEISALKAIVNMALMDETDTHKKKEFITTKILHSSCKQEFKKELLEAYNDKKTFKVDFTAFKGDPISSTLLMRQLVEILQLSDNLSISGKIYLNKISRELGYSPQDIEEFLTK